MKSSKSAWLAAGVSLAALSAATGVSAQPLANPLLPPSTRPAAPVVEANRLRPRVGVQVAYTDNVKGDNNDKQSDVLGRVNVGLAGVYNSPRAALRVDGDVLYDVYSKNQKYDSLSVNGVAAASYIVAPQILAIEAAGAATQGSATSFGTTDFYRAGNANDYKISTYYVGPHLTISPGVLDISAAARYGQVLYDSNSTTLTNLHSDASFYQLIGAADTKDRLGRLRLVTSAQYQADDQDFEATSGSVSGFYQATVFLTGIARVGYDDTQLTATRTLKSPFWSVGGQYLMNETSFLRIEGGERYKEPYVSAGAQFQASRTVTIVADYKITQSPGSIAISNVLVDYVGGLNDPLPAPIAPPSFGLNTTYFDEPSLNRDGSVRVLMDLGRQQIGAGLDYNEQKVQTNPDKFKTFSQEVSYSNQIRADMVLSAAFRHSGGNGSRIPVGSGNVGGDYYQVSGRADYGLNTRTRLAFELANRRFRADRGAANSDYDENIASIALVRQFQ
jgi:uncharacterized protein (PEP-CTERM system associated)